MKVSNIILICFTTVQVPEAGSVPAVAWPCSDCNKPVWISRGSVKLVESRQPPTVICMECFDSLTDGQTPVHGMIASTKAEQCPSYLN